MAKKRNTKASEKTATSFNEAIGINKFFGSERINFVTGFCLLIVAGYLIWAFVSYFVTGEADQSLIEAPRDGELLNQHHEFANSCGSLGAYASWFFIKRCFGLAAFLIPVFLLMVSVNLMRTYRVKLLKWFMILALLMIWSSVTMARFLSPFFADACFNPGGDHGLAISQHIEGLIGMPGLTALLVLFAVAFLVYLSMETVIFLRKLFNPMRYLKKIPMDISVGHSDAVSSDADDDTPAGDSVPGTVEDPVVFDNPQSEIVEFTDLGEGKPKLESTDDDELPTTAATKASTDEIALEVEEAPTEETASDRPLASSYGDITTPYDPKRDLENYHYPTLDLLKKYESDGKPFIDMQEQNANKNRIVDVLRNFGVEISSIKATVGPTITLYEITPAPGVRISKIRNLEDDIALSLSALGIRIIAPIPGKGTIGIEVPNAKPSVVSMESILNSKKFQETTMDLPCAVGKTITNEVFMFDLAKAPHLLVAGATGQGKSVGLNAIITSLL